MQITCPSCAAVYEVPDEKIVGRAVKCARCGHLWTPVPPQPEQQFAMAAEPAAPEAAFAVPDPVSESLSAPSTGRLAASAAPAGRRLPLVAAWVASLVLLAAIAAAAYVERDRVMQAWPPSQRVYATLGLR